MPLLLWIAAAGAERGRFPPGSGAGTRVRRRSLEAAGTANPLPPALGLFDPPLALGYRGSGIRRSPGSRLRGGTILSPSGAAAYRQDRSARRREDPAGRRGRLSAAFADRTH